MVKTGLYEEAKKICEHLKHTCALWKDKEYERKKRARYLIKETESRWPIKGLDSFK